MSNLHMIDAFAGIGGFSVGAERAGIKTTAFIEKDTTKQKVLRAHYPGTPIMGDIHDVRAADFDGLAHSAILAGGFPCQDISIGAPSRTGLDGERSGAFVPFARLLAEFQRLARDLADEDRAPRWVVLENTDGLLTSPGIPRKGSKAFLTWDGVDRTGWDMAAVARAMDDLGYGWAYRLVSPRQLPGRLAGPQRRPRVLVVGHRGGDPRPAQQVLGLTGAGGEAVVPDRERRGSRQPRAVVGPVGDAHVFRKSGRPTKSLARGGFETWKDDGIANVLNPFDGGLATRQTHLIVQGGRVRTWTPLEWERLQAFPDHWTAMIAESARFQGIGDAVHCGMTEWLFRRIVRVHSALPQLEIAS